MVNRTTYTFRGGFFDEGAECYVATFYTLFCELVIRNCDDAAILLPRPGPGASSFRGSQRACGENSNRDTRREWFRPFAPSIQENLLTELFQFKYLSPYMLFSPLATNNAKGSIPAALHIDGTGRVQTVNITENEKFYNLLEEFRKKTGLGALLNTSFNLHGEPIVGSPKDALLCFQKSKIDYLVIDDFIIYK